jgi:hypothetical protein
MSMSFKPPVMESNPVAKVMQLAIRGNDAFRNHFSHGILLDVYDMDVWSVHLLIKILLQ